MKMTGLWINLAAFGAFFIALKLIGKRVDVSKVAPKKVPDGLEFEPRHRLSLGNLNDTALVLSLPFVMMIYSGVFHGWGIAVAFSIPYIYLVYRYMLNAITPIVVSENGITRTGIGPLYSHIAWKEIEAIEVLNFGLVRVMGTYGARIEHLGHSGYEHFLDEIRKHSSVEVRYIEQRWWGRKRAVA